MRSISVEMANVEQVANKMEEMYILIWQYIEFLRASAKAYTNLQDELTQSVTAL